MRLLNNKPYYKTRIIITFTAVTILLVIIISRTAYLFIKDLYLKQLSEQAEIVSTVIGKQIDRDYLNLLEIGTPTGATASYFYNLFEQNADSLFHSEIFIFGNDLNVLVHSRPSFSHGEAEPRLILNRKEISELKTGNSIASMPFKGDDNRWYLWGFFRLNDNYIIAVRENAQRFNQVDALSTLFWFIGLGGVIVSAISGWLVANSITHPLTKLIGFSKEIGKGDFTASPPQKMHGEIAMLSDAMEKMKQNLAQNQNEKENILAQIAHEIRNPLGGILLLVNLIKENIADTETNKEYLDRIIKEINGLKLLITSYLTYSKPLFASPSWIDINKTISEIENMFKIPLKEKNIILEKNIKMEKFYFDEAHLRQIFVNLMNNSVEAIGNSGTIFISAQKKPDWEITFSDDGPGIEHSNLEKIFTPFFTTKINGTGLGLAICRKLSLENNADLSVLKNGKGASFILTKTPV